MKTVFIRATKAAVDDKAAVIRKATRNATSTRFEIDPSTFDQVPRSPFAYWASDAVRECFTMHPPFESEGRDAKQGLATADDFRFVRLATEVPAKTVSRRWFPFAKGGDFSPFYADVYLVVDWKDDGENVYGYSKSFVRNPDFFFRPALTWPLRTQGGLSFRAMPRGCIFGHKGPAAFVEDDDSHELLALAGIANSRAFAELVELQMAFGSYEVGVIQRTPVPRLKLSDVALVGSLAHRGCSLKRRLDSRNESSHAFWLPGLLQADGERLTDRAEAWNRYAAEVDAELAMIAEQINDHAYRLYGISMEDRLRIEGDLGTSDETDAELPDDGDEQELAEADAVPMIASLLSWSLGAAFGRFDVRAAIGERPAPPEPGPFEPLSALSPGMLGADDDLPVAAPPSGYPLTFPTEGFLADDPGHPHDLVQSVRSVFETVFDDADARWHEAAELLGTPELRAWFAGDFFDQHVRRYSRSRRKAPIYWQLATNSGSYSVWIYIHRATGDTLFRVLNDFVGPKLDHEKSKLDGLVREAGVAPSAAQRKDLDQQERFVGELQAFRTEVARVAPLWRPNLDDGVILNFAPLWRLVPQSRSWQSECRKTWDQLVGGDFDWSHLAMHLWPERVVPKCRDDRSLAIAHGLEGVFWHEDEAGTARKKNVAQATVQALVAERTSPTVKTAMTELQSAPAPAGGDGCKAKGRRTPSRSASAKSRPSASRSDEATLDAIRTAIASIPDGAGKAEVVLATGMSDGEWSKAIGALLADGSVVRTGERRGARYHLARGDAR